MSLTIENYIKFISPERRLNNIGYNQMGYDFGIPASLLNNKEFVNFTVRILMVLSMNTYLLF